MVIYSKIRSITSYPDLLVLRDLIPKADIWRFSMHIFNQTCRLRDIYRFSLKNAYFVLTCRKSRCYSRQSIFISKPWQLSGDKSRTCSRKMEEFSRNSWFNHSYTHAHAQAILIFLNLAVKSKDTFQELKEELMMNQVFCILRQKSK